MTVTVTKSTGHTAQITWNPGTDDPDGRLAQLIENGTLEDALTALARGRDAGNADSEATARRLARASGKLARLLERGEQRLAVALKSRHELSWSELAEVLYEDAEKRSSARRKYAAGLRMMGFSVTSPADSDNAEN